MYRMIQLIERKVVSLDFLDAESRKLMRMNFSFIFLLFYIPLYISEEKLYYTCKYSGQNRIDQV